MKVETTWLLYFFFDIADFVVFCPCFAREQKKSIRWSEIPEAYYLVVGLIVVMQLT